VRRDAIDAERFERLIERAELAGGGGDPGAARRFLGEALELWRGPPLADAAVESFARAEILRLEELHLVAQEECIAADLALGRHTMVVGDLESLAAEHPSRERLLRQLMVALYRCGRQADALAAYREGRRCLDEELGLVLSAPTRDLEAAILRQDPSLLTPKEDASGLRQGTPPSLAQGQSRAALPVPADPLIGRERELRALARALVGDRAVRLVSVTGPGGVGKTRVALELARRLAGQYSGGAVVVGLAQLAADRTQRRRRGGACGRRGRRRRRRGPGAGGGSRRAGAQAARAAGAVADVGGAGAPRRRAGVGGVGQL
jgi:hypothetical protein